MNLTRRATILFFAQIRENARPAPYVPASVRIWRLRFTNKNRQRGRAATKSPPPDPPSRRMCRNRRNAVIPAKLVPACFKQGAGIQTSSLRKQGTRNIRDSCFPRKPWMPASAGMTNYDTSLSRGRERVGGIRVRFS